MKLLCKTCIIRRSNREMKGTFQKTTLAIGRKDEKLKLSLIMITMSNKSGTKYELTNNIAGIFRKFVDEGKCTISFKVPEIDLQIQADAICLKSFLNIMKVQLCPPDPTKEQNLKSDNRLLQAFGSTCKMLKDHVTKMTITSRAEFPTKGLPRTLKSLDIIGVNYAQMPIGVLNLTNLTSLNLSQNSIEKLPKPLGNLRLIELNLSENQFGGSNNSSNYKAWEWLDGRNLQSSLVKLNLSKNKLSSLPQGIMRCENLENLDLSHNEIQKLPFSIKHLSRLKHLSLSNNQLSCLPCTIVELKLASADLSSNRFPSYNESLDLLHVSKQNITANHFKAPSLLELSARVAIKYKIPFRHKNIPHIVKEILFYSPNCSNSMCRALCFDTFIFRNISLVSIDTKALFSSVDLQRFLADGPVCSSKCLRLK